jgi:KH domain
LNVQLEVPSSTQRFIIGAKGATLKQIQNISGTRINVPKREKADSEPIDNEDEDAEDVPVSISIVGDADGVRIAKAEIMKIVGEKVIFPRRKNTPVVCLQANSCSRFL